MTGTLTAEQVAAYRRDGFLFPIDLFDRETAAGYRSAFGALEQHYPAGSLPRDLDQYFRVNAHLVIPLAARIALEPAILDIVESILGPDLLVWSCELFIKEPHTPKIVSWHQDLTYWGMGETDEELTAWIALSPATEASGCMRFVPGSHHQRVLPHRDTFDEDNLLSRGQEIAVEVDESQAVPVILAPGQMSLHHGRMFHASGPNGSGDRRIGFVIRYVTPAVRPMVGERDYAMLARGRDRAGSWIGVPPAQEAFDPESLALYDKVLADQMVALAQGAEGDVKLYEVG